MSKFKIFILIFLIISSYTLSSHSQAPKNFLKGTFYESIKDTFLVATPEMKDPRFDKTVIIMLVNNAEGSMGLVINKPIGLISIKNFTGYSKKLMNEKKLNDLKVLAFWGGPVEEDKVYVIHTKEYKSKSTKSYKHISISNDFDILLDIAKNKGPKKSLVILGYSGWAAGQLEGEMDLDEWALSEINSKLIFDTSPNNKWIKAYEKSFLRL